MRVVWVSAHHPDPAAGGGSAHEWELLRFAARHHEIHLITSLTDLPETGSRLGELGVTWESVAAPVHPGPDNRVKVALAMLRAKPTLLLWLLRERWPALRAVLAQAVEQRRPDLVHVTMGELAPVLEGCTVPSTLLLFDSYTRHVDRKLDIERLPRRRIQYTVERRRTAAWERRWYNAATAVASVSDVDAMLFESLLGRPVEVIENPLASAFLEPPGVPRQPDVVAFVGSLAYPPNIDAITWLVEDIWPLVRAARPGARLVVAGRGYGDTFTVPRIRALVEGAGASLHIDVDDIRPTYWGAAVVVAPIRLGAGLRNKIIHAMACGAPVVATTTALEGVPAVPGEHVLVADDAPAFASAIVATMADPTAAAVRAECARGLLDPFAADAIGARFTHWWERTVTPAVSSP